MKGKFFDLDSQKGLYPGAPSYTSAADVRADLDVLTEEEAEAIFAAVSGARTENALPKFNGAGELVASGLLDNGTRIAATLPLQLESLSADGSASQVWLGRRGSNAQINVPTGGALVASINNNVRMTISEYGGSNVRIDVPSALTFSRGGVNRIAVDSTSIYMYVPPFLVSVYEPPTPSGGGRIYVDGAGALKYKGPSGTVTTLAPA